MNFPGDTNLLKEQRPGKCIAGDSFAGKHREISFEFELPFNPHDPANTGQPNWFFCNKCTSMFFASPGDDPLQVTGVCHAGGQHDRGGTSLNFVLPHDLPGSLGPGVQRGWSFCAKCSGLVFFGDSAQAGRCPAGDAHVKQGFDFFLQHNDFYLKEVSL
jgi:hypothetical protein